MNTNTETTVASLLTCPIANYGWRRLEKATQTVEGDEIWMDDDGWVKVIDVTSHPMFVDAADFRRRIDPPEGWELVPLDDVIPNFTTGWDPFEGGTYRKIHMGECGTTPRQLLSRDGHSIQY